MLETNSEKSRICRFCGQSMQLLDEAQQRWYCNRDNQVWLENEQKWKDLLPPSTAGIEEQPLGSEQLPTARPEIDSTPTCRICGQSMQFLGEDEKGRSGSRWYCYKDDQVWVADDQRWLGQIASEASESQAEQPQTKQTQTVKYCKKCGNQLELEDEFCDKCGKQCAKQKKIVALEQNMTASATTLDTETGLQREPERAGLGIRPSILIALVLVLILAVAVAASSIHTAPQIGYGGMSQATTFTIEIQSDTSWQGSIGSNGNGRSVDGSGNQNFQLQGTIVTAVIQMTTSNFDDSLTVTIVNQNNVALATQTSTAAYGVVSVTATSSQTGSQAIQTTEDQTGPPAVNAWSGEPGPFLELSPAVASVGSTVKVSGTGFWSGDTSCSLFASDGSLMASYTCLISGGTLSASFVVANVANGVYTITATGSPGQPGDSASATFSVS